MNKKILILSLLAVFMLVSISFVSAAEMNTDVEKKESPLFGIRTAKAINEKIGRIIDNIRTKFIGEKLFFIPSVLRCFSQTSSDQTNTADLAHTCIKGTDTTDGSKYCDFTFLEFCTPTGQPAWCILYEVKG
jgi:hypothetical protein